MHKKLTSVYEFANAYMSVVQHEKDLKCIYKLSEEENVTLVVRRLYILA